MRQAYANIAIAIAVLTPGGAGAQDIQVEGQVAIESEWGGGSNSDHYVEENPRRVIGLDQNFDGRIDKNEYLDFMVGKLEYNSLSISAIGRELISTDEMQDGQSSPSKTEVEEKRAYYEAEYDRRMEACNNSLSCTAEMARRGAIVIDGSPSGS